MADTADKVLQNKSVIVWYFAILLILVFLMVWWMPKPMGGSEHYFGYGMPDSPQVLASGPTMRQAAQFTGTNQGENPITTADVKQLNPGVFPERMTASA